jgi:V/A-type H+-transporting ATPase subunit C
MLSGYFLYKAGALLSYSERKDHWAFCRYPPVGEDDWRYSYEVARVRALETRMLTQAAFLEMANTERFEAAADLLAGTEYEAIQGNMSLPDIENILLDIRKQARSLFLELMLDKSMVEIWQAREDYVNMKLAVRRLVTGRALGIDYSKDGTVAAADFQEVFEQENYNLFPDYLQEAVEQAILSYYINKDIREIDYAIDRVESAYRLGKAYKLTSIFLQSLFRTQIDLVNIRTMLRLKWRESEQQGIFIDNGFIELSRFRNGPKVEYDALAGLFFATPYYEIIESGVNYLKNNHSFLRLEQQCESHLMSFLKMTRSITAGPQPIIAYLLLKENEIRKVRLILTGKKHILDVNLLLDRLCENK